MHAGGDTVTESISCENDYKVGMHNPQISETKLSTQTHFQSPIKKKNVQLTRFPLYDSLQTTTASQF